MSEYIKKMGSKFLLLIFILGFVQVYSMMFGQGSIYIAAFSLTAVLMFSQFNLKLPRKLAVLLFPTFFVLSVIIPYIINQSKYLWLNMTLVLLSILLMLFFLSPSLGMESYIPFLLLYAVNLNTPLLMPLKTTIFAAFIGGVVTSIVYFINHPKSDDVETFKTLKHNFKKYISFIVKLTAGFLLAYYVGYELNYVKTSWILFTVISLTEIDLARTHRKLWQRILGTGIGVVIYVLFAKYVMANYPKIIPILLILITYIYTFINDYLVRVIFITFNAINAAVISAHLDVTKMPVVRFEYIILGAIIAVLVGWIYHLMQHYLTRRAS